MTLLEIVNEVDKLVLDKAIRNKFTNHIKRLCKMVEDYGQAQQPYSKKLENAKKRIDKFTPKQLEKYKLPNGQISISLVDVCPPPKGYIKMNYWDNYFINVPLGTIYRPKEPVNPLLWFGLYGNSGLQRIPSKSEQLMCDYVRLAIIHDYEIRFSGTPSDRYICLDKDYKGKWFRRDEFFKDIWAYYHYDTKRTGLRHLSATDQEKLSQLERAFERIKRGHEKGEEETTTSEKEYSLPLPMKKWAEILGFSENKMKEVREAGDKYHFDKVSARKWRLPKNELPAEYLERYRAITKSKPQ